MKSNATIHQMIPGATIIDGPQDREIKDLKTKLDQAIQYSEQVQKLAGEIAAERDKLREGLSTIFGMKTVAGKDGLPAGVEKAMDFAMDLPGELPLTGRNAGPCANLDPIDEQRLGELLAYMDRIGFRAVNISTERGVGELSNIGIAFVQVEDPRVTPAAEPVSVAACDEVCTCEHDSDWPWPA